jgi:Beta-1,3-glucanase
MGCHPIRLRRALARAMSLAVFLAGIWLPSLALGAVNNEGLELVPFTVNVNSITPLHVFAYIKGAVAQKSVTYQPNTVVYVTNQKGDVTITPVISSGSLALDLGTAATTSMMLPKLKGMRIYFSIGAPLLVSESEMGGDPDILGGGWTPGGANYNTIFDWAELDWQNEPANTHGYLTRFGGNVTQVDQFGFPMYLQIAGTDPATDKKVTLNAGIDNTLSTIMGAYMALGTPWTNLVVTSGGPPPLFRVIAPYHGIGLGTFPSNFLDAYIGQVWSYYKTNTMIASAENSSYTGSTASGNLVFSENGVPKFQFSMPSTLTVFENEVYSKNAILISTEPRTAEKAGVVATFLGAGFMRTVLIANPDITACQVNQFYANAPVNQYAKLWHQYQYNHKAYAYGYDDTCSQSSYIVVVEPTAVTITLTGN